MAISMAVMPSDQMSAFESYPLCLITSGGIQYGVPTNWNDTARESQR